MSLRSRDLVVGGRYIHCHGELTRTIDRMEGKLIYWHDDYQRGCCHAKAFVKSCVAFAPGAQPKLTIPMRKTEVNEAMTELAGNLVTLQGYHYTVAKIVSPLEWRVPPVERSELREALDKSSDLLERLRLKLDALLSL